MIWIFGRFSFKTRNTGPVTKFTIRPRSLFTTSVCIDSVTFSKFQNWALFQVFNSFSASEFSARAQISSWNPVFILTHMNSWLLGRCISKEANDNGTNLDDSDFASNIQCVIVGCETNVSLLLTIGPGIKNDAKLLFEANSWKLFKISVYQSVNS